MVCDERSTKGLMAMAEDLRIRPKQYERQTNDVPSENIGSARFIGNLRNDISRINVFSALTKTDKVDYFKFRVYEGGKIGMGITGDGKTHIQLMDRSGRVIADNEANSGETFKNFELLQKSRLELAPKEYYLKITRGTGVSGSVNPNYAIQLNIGTKYNEDYTTIERPASRATTRATPVESTALNILTQSKDRNGFINIFA
jgi:hypothetical protein